MKVKTKQIITDMISRLQFYLESIGAFTPIHMPTYEQLLNTRGVGGHNH